MRAFRWLAALGAAVLLGSPALAQPFPAKQPSKAVVPTPENIQLRNRVQAESLGAPEAAARVIRAWLADAA